MNRLVCVTYSFFFILVWGLTSVFAKGAPTSAEQLRSDFESALKAKNTNAVISLFNSEGGTNDWRESAGMRQMMITSQTYDLLKTDVTDVKLASLSVGFQPARTNEANGICQKYNVNVVGMIDVKLQSDRVVELPYGKRGDAFYIAGITLERIPGILLSVNVSAGPDPDSLTFTGSWVYVTDGKEIKVDISDKINRFKMCWGDYIKSCTIQRTSTNSLDKPGFTGWFFFDVLEGGTNIFESPQMTNEEPVVYERK
jgi:hypothetical protein